MSKSTYLGECTIGYYRDIDIADEQEEVVLDGNCLHTGRGEILIDPDVVRNNLEEGY